MKPIEIPPIFDELTTEDILLLDLIKEGLPAPPPMPKGIASGTRSPTKEDVDMHTGLQLQHVVHAESLFDSVADYVKEWCNNRKVFSTYPSQRWATFISSKTSSYLLPTTVVSESDTALWVFTVLIRPAIAVVQALLKDVASGAWQLQIQSAAGSSSRPDGIIYTECPSDSSGQTEAPRARLALEYKTSNALSTLRFRDFDRVARDHAGRGHGKSPVFRFWWPKKSTGLNMETKILTQLWAQMMAREVKFAILSSYDSTRFFFCEGNTLYMTHNYTWEDTSLPLAMAACLFLASGRQPFNPPRRLHRSWWPEVVLSGPPKIEGIVKYGIDERLLATK